VGMISRSIKCRNILPLCGEAPTPLSNIDGISGNYGFGGFISGSFIPWGFILGAFIHGVFIPGAIIP